MKNKKEITVPLLMWAIFEAVAVTLWRTKDNLFYLINFSYIGTVLAVSLFLFAKKHRNARRFAQLFHLHLPPISIHTSADVRAESHTGIAENYFIPS